MIELYSNRDKHEHVPGDPRGTFGRALFNVKSRTLRVLTMASYCRHGNSSLFSLFFIESKMQELTPILKQDMD